MSENTKSPYSITNMDEWNKLASQLKDLLDQIENFEFKFYSDENPTSPLEVVETSPARSN